MKAALCERYGPPEVVRIGEVPTPTPAAGEVLDQGACDDGQLGRHAGARGTVPPGAGSGGAAAPRLQQAEATRSRLRDGGRGRSDGERRHGFPARRSGGGVARLRLRLPRRVRDRRRAGRSDRLDPGWRELRGRRRALLRRFHGAVLPSPGEGGRRRDRPGQRRLGCGRHHGRAAGQAARRRRDRRVQRRQRGAGQRARGRHGHRLHGRGLHRQRPALRRDHRHPRQRSVQPHQGFTAAGWPLPDGRRRSVVDDLRDVAEGHDRRHAEWLGHRRRLSKAHGPGRAGRAAAGDRHRPALRQDRRSPPRRSTAATRSAASS